MNVCLNPGRYVVAVSGGVDSIVLLHLLSMQKDLELTVAHFDHGIRNDSADDARFVQGLAEHYELKFETTREELGADAGENTARIQRYKFLKNIKDLTGAQAIVTAHHQDDVIETAALNMLRGTKRRGLVSLRSTRFLQRPLLPFTKHEIIEYALKHKLEWHQDSTNTESNYLRNKLRKKMAPNLTKEHRRQIVKLLDTVREQSDQIDEIIISYLHQQPENGLWKLELTQLEPEVGFEVVAGWLRLNNISFDKTAIVRVINGARTLQNGAQIDVQSGWYCLVSKDKIVLSRRSSV